MNKQMMEQSGDKKKMKPKHYTKHLKDHTYIFKIYRELQTSLVRGTNQRERQLIIIINNKQQSGSV